MIENYEDPLEGTVFDKERKQLHEERDRARIAASNDMKTILRSAEGRRFIFWLIERGAPFRSDYNGRSLDLAYNCGVKAISSEVLGMAISADPTIFTKFVEDRLTKEEEK